MNTAAAAVTVFTINVAGDRVGEAFARTADGYPVSGYAVTSPEGDVVATFPGTDRGVQMLLAMRRGLAATPGVVVRNAWDR